MPRFVAFVVVFVVVCLPAWASEPGQPMDCTDWIMIEPGLVCEEVVPFPCPHDADGVPRSCFASLTTRAFDNDGTVLRVKRVRRPDLGMCGGFEMYRTELQRLGASGVAVLGYIDDRCVDPGSWRTDQTEAYSQPRPSDETHNLEESFLLFDATTGSLHVSVNNRCRGFTGTTCPAGYQDPGQPWLLRVSGFTTLFEILQTYTSTANVSFRVPYMPEGFQYADYFDTYYGDLAAVGDWSQAQPLRCGYPATAPAVGDYLTVDDTLPTPASGQGYYYVTAVNYQGQRRYGRQSNGGVLSGRDPAVLPVCN